MNCVYLYVDSADVESINFAQCEILSLAMAINHFEWANNCSSNSRNTPQKVIFIIFYACVYLFMLSQRTMAATTATIALAPSSQHQFRIHESSGRTFFAIIPTRCWWFFLPFGFFFCTHLMEMAIRLWHPNGCREKKKWFSCITDDR